MNENYFFDQFIVPSFAPRPRRKEWMRQIRFIVILHRAHPVKSGYGQLDLLSFAPRPSVKKGAACLNICLAPRPSVKEGAAVWTSVCPALICKSATIWVLS